MARPHIDLFSGIGGFSLAAHWAGFQTEVFCEQDQFCNQVLRKHWPTTPIVDDIRSMDGTRYAGAELLTGGFPCQPFSVAGKRGGASDDRYLWPEMLRVISDARPRWIVAENVPGIIGMALDDVLADLEEEGYETGALVLPACAVNAPHKRERVWIVANADGWNRQSVAGYRPELWDSPDRKRPNAHACGAGDESHALPDTARKSNRERHTKPSKGQIQQLRISDSKADVAHSVGKRLEKREIESTREKRQTAQRSGFTGRLSQGSTQPAMGRVAHGLPGWLDGHFDAEPDIPRVATGITNRAARLKALGNAIVPQVAYMILQRIGAVDDREVCYG